MHESASVEPALTDIRVNRIRCRMESEASCPVKLGGTAEEFQPFGPFDHFDDEEIAWLFLFNRKVPLLNKTAPRGIALRRQGIMSPKRPAAGGESRGRDSFLIYRKVLLLNKNRSAGIALRGKEK